MFPLRDFHAFKASLDLLFNSVRRHDLVEYDSQLPVSFQSPRRTHLQDRPLKMAALWQNQLVRNNQRLTDNRIHWIAFLARRRTQWCNQQRMHHTSRRRRITDRRNHVRLQRFRAKLQWNLQVRIKAGSSVDVLRAIWGLSERVPL